MSSVHNTPAIALPDRHVPTPMPTTGPDNHFAQLANTEAARPPAIRPTTMHYLRGIQKTAGEVFNAAKNNPLNTALATGTMAGLAIAAAVLDTDTTRKNTASVIAGASAGICFRTLALKARASYPVAVARIETAVATGSVLTGIGCIVGQGPAAIHSESLQTNMMAAGLGAIAGSVGAITGAVQDMMHVGGPRRLGQT